MTTHQYQLPKLLAASETFTKLPLDKREVFLRMAHAFEQHADNAIQLTATELATSLNLGNKQLWQDFLNLQPVIAFIRAEMAALAQVAIRKNMKSLQREAMQGNVQAAKMITELSGVLTSGEQNKIFVMHRVNRNQTTAQPPEPQKEVLTDGN